MSRGQGRRGSEFGEMSAETPRAFDSPTVDRAVIGGPSQRGAVPGAGVGKVGVPEFAAPWIQHGCGERPAVRVDADDVVVCPHDGCLRF
jgi:hypothetical protein